MQNHMSLYHIMVMQNPSFRKSLGARLKQLRKQKRWSQKELATKVGIRFQQLNKYESGLNTPPLEVLIKFADALGTTTDHLLSGQPTELVPIHNMRLLERFKALEQVNTEDQEAVIKLIDAVIIKARAEGIFQPLDQRNKR